MLIGGSSGIKDCHTNKLLGLGVIPVRVSFILGGVFLFVIGSSNACMKRKSKPSGVLGAVVSGYAANESGMALPGVDVLLEGTGAPISKTDATGHFRAVISEAYLVGLSKNSPKERELWSIFVRQISANSTGGISEPMAMTARGELDAGVITMRDLTTLKGKVIKADGNSLTPAASAKISIGPDRLVTAADGTFQLKNAIPGKNPVLAELTGFEKTLEVIDVEVSGDMNHEEPVVFFNTTMPSAVLIPKASLSADELNGARTTRSFYVKATPSAKFIRYHHRIEELEKSIPLPDGLVSA